MGTKRVVPLVTSAQYTDPREWHGPVGGFLVDQFWECYVKEEQLETTADNIAERVLLYKCEQQVRPPSSPCLCLPDSLISYRHRLTTWPPPPRAGPSASRTPPRPAAQAGMELPKDALGRLKSGIDEHLKQMKQQAAHLRVQRGPVTTY